MYEQTGGIRRARSKHVARHGVDFVEQRPEKCSSFRRIFSHFFTILSVFRNVNAYYHYITILGFLNNFSILALVILVVGVAYPFSLSCVDFSLPSIQYGVVGGCAMNRAQITERVIFDLDSYCQDVNNRLSSY